MAATPPFVRDSSPLYPYAGGGGGSGTGGGGGAVFVGPLATPPNPYVYGQWIVTGDMGPWAGPVAAGVFTLMVSNGTTWFPVATGGGGGGGGIPEVYAATNPPASTGGTVFWVDTDSGAGLLSADAVTLSAARADLPTDWTDTFDREDAIGYEEVGNGWTPDPRMLGDLEISGGSLLLHSGAVGGYQRYYTYAPTAAPFAGDIAIEVDWPASNIRWGTGLMCRFDETSTRGVRCWLTGPDSVELGDATWWDVGNVPLTTVAEFPKSWGTSDVNTLRLELHGDNASIYANGVLVRTGVITVNHDINDGAVGLCGEATDRVIQAVRVFAL